MSATLFIVVTKHLIFVNIWTERVHLVYNLRGHTLHFDRGSTEANVEGRWSHGSHGRKSERWIPLLSSQIPFSIIFNPGPQTMGWSCSHSAWVQLYISRDNIIHTPEVCFHGDSKSCLLDNEDYHQMSGNRYSGHIERVEVLHHKEMIDVWGDSMINLIWTSICTNYIFSCYK